MIKRISSITSKSDVEQLRKSFELEGTELDQYVGREGCWTPDGAKYERKGVIIGIQKAWGHNEKGEYVFGIPSFIVKQTEAFIDEDGDEILMPYPSVISPKQFKMI